MNLEERVTKLKEEIRSQMLSSHKSKYRWFLRTLRTFKYFEGSTRGELLETYYFLMRHVDDIADGSNPRNLPIELRPAYIERRINFVTDSKSPQDDADYLMLRCFNLAERLDLDFTRETLDILSSLHFDASRVGRNRIFTESELAQHFYFLDIRGTTRAALKIFREDPRKQSSLEDLARASRIYYNLRDYDEDIGLGFINMPAEDIDNFQISVEDIKDKQSPTVRKWIQAESSRGLELLERYKTVTNTAQFRLLTRLTLMLVYYGPARRYFEKVLKA